MLKVKFQTLGIYLFEDAICVKMWYYFRFTSRLRYYLGSYILCYIVVYSKIYSYSASIVLLPITYFCSLFHLVPLRFRCVYVPTVFE